MRKECAKVRHAPGLFSSASDSNAAKSESIPSALVKCGGTSPVSFTPSTQSDQLSIVDFDSFLLFNDTWVYEDHSFNAFPPPRLEGFTS